MRKVILTLMVALGFVLNAAAQDRTITGRVTDEKGQPLAGASVTSSDGKGTQTDEKGNFRLSVTGAAKTITISSVNQEPQTRTIGNLAIINASLEAKNSKLDEVVVVGYGATRKKIDEAGAISSVRGSQIENLPSVSLDKALQGKAAGVLVQSNNGIPGGAITVRIRGEGSINAGNQPLYVIDGVQFNTRNDAAFTQSNPLAFLNPDDIESIDIIKDAATAAIYGSTASNGVVLITTKKGKAGKTRYSANVSYGLVQPLKRLDVLNSQEFYQLRLEAVGNTNNLAPTNLAVKRNVLGTFRVAGAAAFTDAQADSAAASLPTYDWQSAVIRTGQIKTIEVSASGGTDKMLFRVSASHENQETFITKADFERYGLKIDLTNKFTDRLTFNTSVNLSSSKQNNPFATDGSTLGNAAFSASGIFPMSPIKNPDGSYYGVPGTAIASIIGSALTQNIVQVTDYNTGYTRNNQLVGFLSADYKISNSFSAKVFTGLDYRIIQAKNVRDARTADAFVRKGLVQVQSNWNTNLNAFATVNYNHAFGKHRVDGLAGYELRRENNESISAAGDGFPTFEFQTLNTAANQVSIGEFFTGFRRNGTFANLNYNYDRRYIIGVTGRYDGSSRFGDDNKFGTFYGVKAGWNIDQESFLNESKVISQLRLRYGYGVVGNDQIGNFDGLGLFGGGFVYNGSAGTQYTNLENPNLKWERGASANFGIDFGLFRNRISGAVEFYKKKTSDLLLQQNLQSTTGFLNFTSNVGKLENKGIEVSLNADIIRAKNSGSFNWNASFVFGYNKQKLTELYDGQQFLADNSIRVGQPVGVLFTQKYAGVNASTGRAMWYDSLGNLTYLLAARDRQIIGPTRLPIYQGGLTNTFSLKGFSVTAFFNYEYGRLAQDGQVNFLSESLARINNLQYIYDERWTTPGQLTAVPRMNTAAEAKSSGSQSGSRTWFKADYIRLKTMMLSYDLPADNNLIKRAKITGFRFYVQGTNLFTYSDTYGYDVEFVGTATGIIPQSRIITTGVQVGF